MKKSARNMAIIFAMVFSNVGLSHAACTLYSYNEIYTPYAVNEQLHGIAFATETTPGACKDACKTWGTTGGYRGEYYSTYYYAAYTSHPYWFPGTTTNVKCEVSDDMNHWRSVNSPCPIHYDGGVPSCNY